MQNDHPKFDKPTYFLGAMFHASDDIVFQKSDVSTQTYSTLCDGAYRPNDPHFLFRYPTIFIHKVAEKSIRHIKDGRVLTDNLTFADTISAIDYNLLAGIMANMSMRGETKETFEEALAFLKRLPVEVPTET